MSRSRAGDAWLSRALFEKIGRACFEDVGDFLDHVDSWAINAAFQGADVGPVQTGAMGQFFLGDIAGGPTIPEIGGECFSYHHEARLIAL